MASVAAVILAAGGSRRHLAGDKLLRDFRGRPLALHPIERAKASEFRSVHIVVRDAQSKLAALSRARGVQVIECVDAHLGIGASLSAGVAALLPTIDGAAIFLADMPDISRSTIARLLKAFAERPGCIIRPVFDGAPGHPVIFPSAIFADLMTLRDDIGARDLVRRYPTFEISVEDEGVVLDFDDDAAFERFR